MKPFNLTTEDRRRGGLNRAARTTALQRAEWARQGGKAKAARARRRAQLEAEIAERQAELAALRT